MHSCAAKAAGSQHSTPPQRTWFRSPPIVCRTHTATGEGHTVLEMSRSPRRHPSLPLLLRGNSVISSLRIQTVLAKPVLPVLLSHDERALLPAAAGRGCARATLHLQRGHYSAVAASVASASAAASGLRDSDSQVGLLPCCINCINLGDPDPNSISRGEPWQPLRGPQQTSCTRGGDSLSENRRGSDPDLDLLLLLPRCSPWPHRQLHVRP